MKKFLIGLLNVILSILVFALLFSFYGKMVFSSFITNFLGGVSTSIPNTSFIKENNKDKTKVTIEKNLTVDEFFGSPEYKELLKNKEVKGLIDKYIDSTIEGVTDPDSLDDVKLGDEVVNFIIENQEVLEKEYNIDISSEDIKKMQEDDVFKELTDNYIQSVKTASASLSKTQKNMIKAYTFICGTTFKIIVIVLIVINIVLISLLQGSFLKWINTIGVNLLTSGILTIILGLILHFSIIKIIARLNLSIRFNFLKVSLIGLIAAIIGGIIMVIYYFIKKLIEKNESDDLYDEVSKGEDDYELSLDDI